MRKVCGTGVVLVAALLAMAGTATAGGIKLCVPKKEGSAVLTPKHGKCKKGYTLTSAEGEGQGGKQGPEGKPGPKGEPGPKANQAPKGNQAPKENWVDSRAKNWKP